MIAGHLTEKNGYWHVVLELRDQNGKRKPKWISTHLKIKGNKKRAEEILMELRREYTSKQEFSDRSKAVFFDAYLAEWLESRRGKIAPNTFSGYQKCIDKGIRPYFRKLNVLLSELKPRDIQAYYDTLYSKGLSGTTVLHHHVLIRKALEDAWRKELVSSNPADKVERPKGEQYVADCYSVEECNRLLEAIKGEPLPASPLSV